MSILPSLSRVFFASLASLFLLLTGAPVGADILSPEERAWIEEHDGKIRFAPDPDFPPMGFRDDDGIHRGVSADYIRLIEERLGFRFKIVWRADWAEIMKGARDGTVDVVENVQDTKDRRKYLNFTTPFLHIPAVIFMRSGSSNDPIGLEDLSGKKVAIVEEYATVDHVRQINPDIDIVLVKDSISGLQALSVGEVDAVVSNMAVASFQIDGAGISNLQVVGNAGYVWRLGFGTRADWPILNGILQKGLDSITPEERAAIWIKWIKIGQSDHPGLHWRTVQIALGVVIVAGLMAGVWILVLQRQVRSRTRRLAEQLDLRRESEEKYRLLVESQSDLIVKLDSEARFLYVSPSFCRLFGMTDKELAGDDLMSLAHGGDRKSMAKAMEALFEPPHTAYMEHRALTKDGWRWLAWTESAILDRKGNVIEIIGIGRDVHERKIAEIALVESELKFRKVLEDIPLIGISLDPQARITFANDHFLNLTGYSTGDVLGENWFTAFIPPSERPEIRDLFNKTIAEADAEPFTSFENNVVDREGRRLTISWSNVPTKNSRGQVIEVTCLGVDITERKRSELALKTSERRLALALRSTDDGLWDWVSDNDELFLSSRWKRMLGYEDHEIKAENDPFPDLLHPEDKERVLQAIKDFFRGPNKHYEQEFRLRHKNGDYLTIQAHAFAERDENGHVVRFTGRHTDVTHLRKMERQLLQTQKLESVGRLAAGIAHDFNNLLQIIFATVDLARLYLEKDEPDRAEISGVLANALDAADRGSRLTQKLLTFSRERSLRAETFDPVALVGGMTEMLKRLLGEEIEVRTEFGTATPHVKVDPNALENAILNAAMNARQAMTTGGVFTVRIGGTRLDHDIHADEGLLAAGTYLEIALIDDGCGMDRETAERAFEPFFSTREVGQGNGLGLSMLYGFAKQSHGHATIQSEPGKGTEVRILLPAASESARPNVGPGA